MFYFCFRQLYERMPLTERRTLCHHIAPETYSIQTQVQLQNVDWNETGSEWSDID